jgi:hypothetical protein
MLNFLATAQQEKIEKKKQTRKELEIKGLNINSCSFSMVWIYFILGNRIIPWIRIFGFPVP